MSIHTSTLVKPLNTRRNKAKNPNGFKEFLDPCKSGCGAKNLALLQNQCKPSQLRKLINLIAGKKVHKGKNHSIKLRKYYFCTTTVNHV